jgi:hypothetical protein
MPQGEGPSREQNRRRRLPHHRSRDVRRRFRQRNSARPAPSGRVAPVELGRKGSRDPDTQWREWGSQSPPPRSGRALSRLLCGMALARSPSVSRTTRWAGGRARSSPRRRDRRTDGGFRAFRGCKLHRLGEKRGGLLRPSRPPPGPSARRAPQRRLSRLRVPTAATGARARGEVGPSLVRLLRWVRLVAVLGLLSLALQPIGVWHIVADTVVTVSGATLHEGRPPCSHEEDGEDCPPNCPDCHCFLATPALLPELPSVVAHRPIHTPTTPTTHEARAPRGPPRRGLERPPRAAVFSLLRV